jgi:hypothetical protein
MCRDERREVAAVKVACLAARLRMGRKSDVTQVSSTVANRVAADMALQRARKEILATMSS